MKQNKYNKHPYYKMRGFRSVTKSPTKEFSTFVSLPYIDDKALLHLLFSHYFVLLLELVFIIIRHGFGRIKAMPVHPLTTKMSERIYQNYLHF